MMDPDQQYVEVCGRLTADETHRRRRENDIREVLEDACAHACLAHSWGYLAFVARSRLQELPVHAMHMSFRKCSGEAIKSRGQNRDIADVAELGDRTGKGRGGGQKQIGEVVQLAASISL